MTFNQRHTAGDFVSYGRRVLRRQGSRVERGTRRLLDGRIGGQAGPPAVERIGVVEEFTESGLAGWVMVPDPAARVRVTLQLDDLPVAATWATGEITRNGTGVARGFRLALRDIWTYVGPQHRLTVRADGVPLPIVGHGMHLVPDSTGDHNPVTLRKRLDSGFVFSRLGALQLSKQHDHPWQRRMLGCYTDLRYALANAGYDVFAMYGSLLGAAREKGFIGHDDDFDVAILARGRTAAQACAELKQIAFALIDAGFDVRPRMSALHVHQLSSRVRIDIFHLYFDSAGVLRFPFGAAGEKEFRIEQWDGVVEVPFGVGRVLVPANTEALAETIYGTHWRVPSPGFNWDSERRVRATDALLPLEDREEIYWANFYARTEYNSGSTFFEAVNARPDVPAHVIDIGCGDGRDSYAFAAAGRTVTGLDRSHIGLRHAGKKAADMGMDRVDFMACDVADGAGLRAVLNDVLARAGGELVLFYARFFLHSIPTQVQDMLMDAVRDLARPGDMFAAEFRTTADRGLPKVHEKHYRRFQDGPTFGAALRERYGFDVRFEVESAGLSPYGVEDPVLYRVVAVKG
jgi:SAM-dependent methyltransferase